MDVSNVSVQTTQAVQNSTTSIPQQAAQQGGQMDFLALILQMLGGTGEESPKELLAMFLEKGKKDAEQEGENLAIQMMMEMLAANPAAGLNMQMVSPEMLSELTGGTVPALERFFAMEGIGTMDGQQNLLQELMGNQQPENTQNVKSEGLFEVLETVTEESANPEEIIIPVTAERRSAQQQDFFDRGANEFRSAISQAKQELDLVSNRGAKEDKKINLDVDQLQHEVDSGKYQVNAAEAEKLPEAPVTPADIASQVKEGIIKEIGSGKDEFIVKLKPEGLGEITVRLMQEGDRIALSISASNSHVARLLSSEIEQLRESLRPYNTVVQEVVDQQAYASNQDFGQSFGNSQYQQRQYEGGRQGHSRVTFQDLVNGEAPEDGSASHRVISTGLNTYIV